MAHYSHPDHGIFLSGEVYIVREDRVIPIEVATLSPDGRLSSAVFRRRYFVHAHAPKKELNTGEIRHYWRHRLAKMRLRGAPGSREFAESYLEALQELRRRGSDMGVEDPDTGIARQPSSAGERERAAAHPAPAEAVYAAQRAIRNLPQSPAERPHDQPLVVAQPSPTAAPSLLKVVTRIRDPAGVAKGPPTPPTAQEIIDQVQVRTYSPPIQPMPRKRDARSKDILRLPAETGVRDNAATSLPVYLTESELIERYRNTIAPGTLRNWRHQKIGPPALRAGRAILYRLDLVQEWEERQLSPKPKP